MKTSPLHEKHIALQAKMADFGGWLMPIEYPGAGVLAEHTAVRQNVGLFDVSHLGKASVTGTGATDFLNSVLTNDLLKIANGQAQYNMLCNESGGVVDDLIVYRNSEEDYFLIPNAANTAEVVEILRSHSPDSISITNLHDKFAVLALQGPRAFDVIASLGINLTMDYMAFDHVAIEGCDVILCRTGYTGEKGFEIVPTWQDAPKVWDVLVSAIAAFSGEVCGLGARDTLRTEMGYPLHGHELTPDISPVQAGAQWAVGWKKNSFLGSTALHHEREHGPKRVLKALIANDRGIPRPGMMVKNQAGIEVGIVTSGTFSPSLKKGIALALLEPSINLSDEVIIDVRGRDSKCSVTQLPLVPSHVR